MSDQLEPFHKPKSVLKDSWDGTKAIHSEHGWTANKLSQGSVMTMSAIELLSGHVTATLIFASLAGAIGYLKQQHRP